ncbi:PAS sensor protein [Halovivax asiaticus JCM 14624]|uniref:histidine kinase n=1 Tax=Halovivax asiaticus JCM 14624 TaxID=1227490 RepID=M0BCS6_9EURY|nr:PAS domain S-box protein [Halovivax asiaticus]ELZ08277.1 PAS sensor protein [Halovivax asiaticus JCM 14624]
MRAEKQVINVAAADARALPLGETGCNIVRVDAPPETEAEYAGFGAVVLGPGLGEDALVSNCEFVVDRAPDVPVLVYTDDGTEHLAGEVVAAGADGYVPASAGSSTLRTRLRELLVADSGERTTDSNRSRATSSLDWNELVVEQSPLAIVEWNRSFEAVRWNDAATALFGYDADEIHGESALETLFPSADHAAVADEWERVVETGEEARTARRNVRADGSICLCEWHVTPLIDDGTVVGVLSFAEDVTEEVRRADALEALQSTTHRLMRSRSRSEIATITIDALNDVIDDPRAGFRYLDPETEELALSASTGAIETTIEGTRIGAGDGVLWDTFTRSEPRMLENVNSDVVPYDLEVEVRDAIVMPVGDDGLLTVASREERTLGETEYHLVDVLAATAAVAVERVDRDRERRRAKTIVETVGDGVYALEPDGTFTTVNDRLESMSGYDRGRLLGSHASLLFPDGALDHVQADIDSEGAPAGNCGQLSAETAAGHRSETVETAEVKLETASGDVVPCEVTSTTLETVDQAIGTVGIVRDVSDRKAMKRAVLDHQQKVATLHDVVGRLEACDTRTEIFEETVNAAEGVLHLDICMVAEAVGDHLEMRAISEGLDESQYTTRRPIDAGVGGQAFVTGETRRVDDIHASDEASPQNDSYQSGLTVPIGEYGMFQAISTDLAAFDERDEELAELLISHVIDALDRLAYEEQLVTERDRFAVLFENVPDAVVTGPIVGSDFLVEETNSAFEATFGLSLEDIHGEPIDEHLAPPDRRDEARTINDRSESGEIVEAEVKRQTTDGLRDFMLRVVPYEVDGKEFAFGLYTDVTDQKQRQKRVEVLNRVLRHDLRNGMNIIEGSAERLASMTNSPEAARYWQAIQDRTAELISLAEKTRAVERTIDRDITAAGPIDATEVVEHAIGRLTEQYPDAEVDRELESTALVRADDLLVDAVYNVLENAVQHTDRDDPTIGVTMREVGEDPETVSIAVADDGPGIPDEERQLLEEDREITQLRHASGLGLWLVDWVVTQSGGELRFEENEPRGTVVELSVPKASVEERQPTITETDRGSNR